MIRIKIGESERSIEEADPNWINEQINGHKRSGRDVCVRVIINGDGVDMVLATRACGGAGGGGRPPNRREQEIFSIWEKLHLNSSEFSGGNVVAFLKQVRK